MATVRATPEEVWKTVTAPELVKQWPYESDLKTDWQPGLED
ncbi:MAG TPA: SRPBCC domain-containing protein [Niabella sp.]